MVISFVVSCLAVLLGLNNSFPAPVYTSMPSLNTFFVTRVATIIFLQNLVWLFLAPFIGLCTLAPWISLVSTLRFQNLPIVRNLGSLLVLLLLGFGISLSNLREAGKALFTNRTWEFTRTPKYADLQNNQDLRVRKYQVPLDHLWMAELAFVILGLWSVGTAIQHANFTVLFILVPFTLSYGFVFLFSILQSRKAKA